MRFAKISRSVSLAMIILDVERFNQSIEEKVSPLLLSTFLIVLELRGKEIQEDHLVPKMQKKFFQRWAKLTVKT